MRGVLCRFLARHGYRSIEASSIDEATTLLKTSPVVAVLVEVASTEPGRTVDTVAQLQAQLPAANTPTIVMTGPVLNDADRQRMSGKHVYLFDKTEGLSALVGFLDQITTHERPN